MFGKQKTEVEKEEPEWGDNESDRLFDVLLNIRELLRRENVKKQLLDEGNPIPGYSSHGVNNRIRALKIREKEILTKYKKQSEIERMNEDE